jgi:hypothetical protein
MNSNGLCYILSCVLWPFLPCLEKLETETEAADFPNDGKEKTNQILLVGR